MISSSLSTLALWALDSDRNADDSFPTGYLRSKEAPGGLDLGLGHYGDCCCGVSNPRWVVRHSSWRRLYRFPFCLRCRAVAGISALPTGFCSNSIWKTMAALNATRSYGHLITGMQKTLDVHVCCQLGHELPSHRAKVAPAWHLVGGEPATRTHSLHRLRVREKPLEEAYGEYGRSRWELRFSSWALVERCEKVHSFCKRVVHNISTLQCIAVNVWAWRRPFEMLVSDGSVHPVTDCSRRTSARSSLLRFTGSRLSALESRVGPASPAG